MDVDMQQIKEESGKELEGKTVDEIIEILNKGRINFQKHTGVILKESNPLIKGESGLKEPD
ncbi:MAG: hypothetical protein AB1633_11615 [Elusimicrobiota bacterium]